MVKVKKKPTLILECYSHVSKAAYQRYSKEKVFWKYLANLQENIHAGIQFQ